METETHDPFADAPPGDDPFADPVVEPDLADPAAEIEQVPVEPEIPTVDREGQPVAETPQEPAPAPETPSEVPAAPETPPETPQEPSEPPAEPSPEPPAAPKAQSGGKKGKAAAASSPKAEMRHYKVFYQTGEKEWTEFPLSAVPEGITVTTDAKGEDGQEPEKWIEARNNDHALRLAYVVLGSPDKGVRIWPVPKGAYKPKRVKPAPPRPERTRLEIS